MAFKPKIDVNSEFLFDKLSDYDVWYAYRDGDVEIGAIESSKFRPDSNPSCGFYLNEKDKIIYNDISTSEKLDCIAYVGKIYNLNYKGAMVRIAEDFGLLGGEAKYQKAPEGEQPKKEKRRKVITIEPDTWSKSYLDYWAKLSLTKKEIEKDVIPAKKVFIDGEPAINYSKSIRFAYPVNHEGTTYYKIYTPYADRAGKWMNNIPIYIPFGIFDLPYKDERLFIVKSQKERLIWKKYLPEVIGKQNESPAALRDATLKYLRTKYKSLYINTDLDAAGVEDSKYFEEKGCIPVNLPMIFMEKHGVKDTAELVEKFGIGKFEAFLKYVKLI